MPQIIGNAVGADIDNYDVAATAPPDNDNVYTYQQHYCKMTFLDGFGGEDAILTNSITNLTTVIVKLWIRQGWHGI